MLETINQPAFVKYDRIELEKMLFSKRIFFNEYDFINWDTHIEYIMNRTIADICYTVLAETKKEDIAVNTQYQEFRSIWDHIKDVINKNNHVPDFIKRYLKVEYITKTLIAKIRLEQYILYPSLDKNIPYVYKMDFEEVEF